MSGYLDYYYTMEDMDWDLYQHEKFIEMRNDLNEYELDELEKENKMRDWQINELEKIADVICCYDTSESTPEEAVEYYIENSEMPEWFDNHDKGILIEFVRKIICI